MLKLVSDDNLPADPLFTCLGAVIRFYRMPTDMSVLASELASYEDQWSMADLPAVSDHLGFKLQITPSTVEEIRDTEEPLILPLENEQFAVVLPSASGANEWIQPGVKPVLLTDDHLTLWDGERVISQVAVPTMLGNVLVIGVSLALWAGFDSINPSMTLSIITLLAVGTGLTFALDVFFKTLRTSKLHRITQDTSSQLENELMTRMLSFHSDNNDFSVGRRSELMARTHELRSFYAAKLVPAVLDSSFFFVFLVAIFLVSPFLALIPLAASVALLGLGLTLKKLHRNCSMRKFQLTQEKSSLTYETLSGNDAFHQFSGSAVRLRPWYDASERAAVVTSENNQWVSIGKHVSVALAQLSLVLTVITGVIFMQAGSLSVAGLIASVLLSISAVSSILNLYTGLRIGGIQLQI